MADETGEHEVPHEYNFEAAMALAKLEHPRVSTQAIGKKHDGLTGDAAMGVRLNLVGPDVATSINDPLFDSALQMEITPRQRTPRRELSDATHASKLSERAFVVLPPFVESNTPVFTAAVTSQQSPASPKVQTSPAPLAPQIREMLPSPPTHALSNADAVSECKRYSRHIKRGGVLTAHAQPLYYYYDRETGRTSWHRPADTVFIPCSTTESAAVPEFAAQTTDVDLPNIVSVDSARSFLERTLGDNWYRQRIDVTKVVRPEASPQSSKSPHIPQPLQNYVGVSVQPAIPLSPQLADVPRIQARAEAAANAVLAMPSWRHTDLGPTFSTDFLDLYVTSLSHPVNLEPSPAAPQVATTTNSTASAQPESGKEQAGSEGVQRKTSKKTTSRANTPVSEQASAETAPSITLDDDADIASTFNNEMHSLMALRSPTDVRPDFSTPQLPAVGSPDIMKVLTRATTPPLPQSASGTVETAWWPNALLHGKVVDAEGDAVSTPPKSGRKPQDRVPDWVLSKMEKKMRESGR